MKLYPYKTLVLKFCCVALLLVVCNRKKIPGSIAQKGATQKDAKIKHLAARETGPHHTPDPERRNNNEHQIIQQEQKEQEDKHTTLAQQQAASEYIETVSKKVKDFVELLKESDSINEGFNQTKGFAGWEALKSAREKENISMSSAMLQNFISMVNEHLGKTTVEEIAKKIREKSGSDSNMLITLQIARLLENNNQQVLDGLNYSLSSQGKAPSDESYDVLKKIIEHLTGEVLAKVNEAQ